MYTTSQLQKAYGASNKPISAKYGMYNDDKIVHIPKFELIYWNGKAKYVRVTS